MLLEYKIKNYKTFKNETVLTMVADSNINEHEYSILDETIDDLNVKGLSAAVIYGPNGVGKTNLIKSLALLQEYILTGTLKSDNGFHNKNGISSFPSINTNEKQDLEFEISFTNKNCLYKFNLKIDAGVFGEADIKPKVTYERLEINDQLVYERIFNNLKDINNEFLSEGLSKNDKFIQNIDSKLNSSNLFLSDGSPLIKDGVIKNFLDWFETKLIIIHNTHNLIPEFKTERRISDSEMLEIEQINEVIKPILHNSKK